LQSFDLCWKALRYFPFERLSAFSIHDRPFFRLQHAGNDDEEKIDGIGVQRFMVLVRNNNIKQIKKERYNVLAFPRQLRTESPIHSAVSLHLIEMVAFLIEQGMDENGIDGNGQTPLHLCAGRGVVQLLKLLLHRGAHHDIHDNEGRTPADLAKIGGHKECWEILFNLGKGVKRAPRN